MINLQKEHIIFTLAHDGELNKLRNEIAFDPKLLTRKASNGSTLLMFAAQAGHLPVVQWLVENGATLGDRAEYNFTALMYAAFNGQCKTVEYLLSKGAAKKEHHNYWLVTAIDTNIFMLRWLYHKLLVWKQNDTFDNTRPSEKIVKRIHSTSTFTMVLPYLNAEQIKTLVIKLQQKNEQLFKEIQVSHFVEIWTFLTSEQKQALIIAFQQRLPELTRQAQKENQYAVNIWPYLTKEQQTTWLETYPNPYPNPIRARLDRQNKQNNTILQTNAAPVIEQSADTVAHDTASTKVTNHSQQQHKCTVTTFTFFKELKADEALANEQNLNNSNAKS